MKEPIFFPMEELHPGIRIIKSTDEILKMELRAPHQSIAQITLQKFVGIENLIINSSKIFFIRIILLGKESELISRIDISSSYEQKISICKDVTKIIIKTVASKEPQDLWLIKA